MLTDKEILEGLFRKKAGLMEELKKLEIAINIFGGNESDTFINQTANNAMTGASEFDPLATVKEKIIFALKRLNKAGAEDIVKYLKLMGDVSNTDSLFKSVTLNASRMYRSGNLTIDKQGKRFIYSIPKSGLMSISDEMDNNERA